VSVFDVAALGEAVGRVKARMASLEPVLNAADAKLGDGDTGIMLARVVDALARIDYHAQPDLRTSQRLRDCDSQGVLRSKGAILFCKAKKT
jgi:hypothetical protein